MNAFYEHHQGSIKFGYRCFDRILLNGLIQPFQQPERVIGFFNFYREGERVTRNRLRDIADQFQNWVKNRAEKWGAPILDAPAGRRDDFVDSYFRRAKADEIVVILKAREPARIMTAIGKEDRWHLQFAQRWIIQYNFYINDARWGRMFVRMCPYLPFSARVCLNQHHWLANRMREEGVQFQQCSNAFLNCSDPSKLQELADSFPPTVNLGNPSDEPLRWYEHSVGQAGSRLSRLRCGHAASRTFLWRSCIGAIAARRQRSRKLLFESPPKACLPRPMSRSGSPAFVPVMQAADLWDRDDSTGFGRLDTARFRRVFLQC
jgi:hypothetical protein